ncbi:uncharacterized protein LOC105209398 [Zeugodacus cucurbitae]|uniref:uncharacterized protein LOC105209398 n=1 Tax=Zeugodacus cucurbitae TaxID=28588 RepID=UPI000596A01E|nr:uncharacterized protein LOC105209398 [Zeugodacus cucurbitae]
MERNIVMEFIKVIACFLAMISQIYGAKKIKIRTEYNVCNMESNWNVFPNDDDCHRFYLCINGKAEEYKCDDNYYFDPKDKRCKIGDCQTMEAINKCTSQNIRRVDGNCQAFSLCENGKYVIQNCTREQYFSTKYASCQPIAISADHKCSCILPPYAIISNPDDCETYYMCIDGKAILQKCPRGQYFSEQVSSCLPDLSGICLIPPTMSSTELAMTNICNSFGNNIAGFQPYVKECDKFFLCINGRVIARRCPKGSYYDNDNSFCRWDVNRICAKSKKLGDANLLENVIEKAEIPNGNEKPKDDAEIKLEGPKSSKESTNGTINKIPTFVQNVISSTDNSNIKEHKLVIAFDQPNKSVYDKLSSKFITF